MPEVAELAHSRDYLRRILIGKKLHNLAPTQGGRWKTTPPPGWEKFVGEIEVRGYPTVEEISTKGKFMWWRFSLPGSIVPYFLHNTYGMSGGWYPAPSKHTGFTVEWKEGSMNFTDPRHFGTLKFLDDFSEHKKKLGSLGPCILGGELTREIFENKLTRKPNRTLSETLLDQRLISGVGNYLRAEIMYAAKVSPWRQIGKITDSEWSSLYKYTLKIAEDSYLSQGATISTYRTPEGDKGKGQFTFKVYGREECPCGHLLLRDTTPDGRTSWWCKVCQS